MIDNDCKTLCLDFLLDNTVLLAQYLDSEKRVFELINELNICHLTLRNTVGEPICISDKLACKLR